MSTRASIIYNEKNGVHIYEENGWVFIEIEKPDVEANISLMSMDDWRETFSYVSRVQLVECNRSIKKVSKDSFDCDTQAL